MFKLLKYIPVVFGIVRAIQRDPRARRAYEQAKKRRARSMTRRR